MPRPTSIRIRIRKTDRETPRYRLTIENPADRLVILTALRVAADQYDRDVATMEAHGALLLADQFKRQAKDARELHERVEELED